MTQTEINPSRVVLVVEDEAIILELVQITLEDGGFAVVTAYDEPEAMAILDDSSHELCAVLTDIRIPGTGDGWSVARHARETRPAIPIVYMTGDSADQWTSQGVPGSMIVQKPFAPAQILAAIATLVNERDALPR